MRRLVNLRIVFGLFLCLTLISAASAWPQQVNHGIRRLQISNKTQFLTIVSVTELNGIQTADKSLRRFQVTVRNGYSLPVVGYAFEKQDVDVGNGTASIEKNGACVGWAVAPNATDDTIFTAPAEGKVVINLSAVLLEDGQGDGEVTQIVEMMNLRAGVKAAFQEVIPVLQRVTDQGAEVNPQSLENEIFTALTPQTIDASLRRGFADAKHFFSSEMRQLKNLAHLGREVEYHSALTTLKARLEERVVKL